MGEARGISLKMLCRILDVGRVAQLCSGYRVYAYQKHRQVHLKDQVQTGVIVNNLIVKMVKRTAEMSGTWLGTRCLAAVLAASLCCAALPLAAQDNQAPPPPDAQQAPAPDQQGADQQNPVQAPPYQQQTPEQLQQLVAPIALYPDSLVAQVLAASTFPEQVVEADRWVQAHPDLKGDALGQAVDQQPWDPSVKALAAFPSVLGNMDKNLSWTSSLGDAYYNQQQDVMDAVQVMRKRAQDSGNLKDTPQQTVTTQGSTIVVQPANPQVVYVPAYNPWLVYGPPVVAWPGWYPYPGIWFGGPYLSFGFGFNVGWFGGFGWGWPHWGFNWHNHYAVYNNVRYYSHSNTFYNRNAYYHGNNYYRGNNVYRGGEAHGVAPGHGVPRPPSAYQGARGVYNHPGASPQPFHGNPQAARGYSQPPHAGQSGVHSGAYSNYDHGGQARSYSYRGAASMGSAPHGGGGGGGGHAGGGGGGHAGGGGHR
jgi:Protein of unknown function (DUF3300)